MLLSPELQIERFQRLTPRRIGAQVYRIKEPQKVPVVLSADEVQHLLLMTPSLKARTMLTISYGCGLRASCSLWR